MNLIEIGGYAGALIAVISLSQKLIHQIASVQKMMFKIDQIQEDLLKSKSESESLNKLVNKQDQRINKIEDSIVQITQNLKELSHYVLR